MTTNADQIAMWNGPAGERRAKHPERTDDQVRRHTEHLRAAAAVGPRDLVLDVGCGTGQTTRDAARAATEGRVLGVDLSVVMLEQARRLSAEEGLGNLTFERADAQVHRFAPEQFDLAISRFGVMFFDDPVAAFTNIGRALRPGARLAMMVWQARELNEWTLEIRRTLAGSPEMPDLPATGHPYTLADPGTVREILGAAGFAEVSLADVHEPAYYGPDPAAAREIVLSLPTATDILAELDQAQTAGALDRLNASLAAHDNGQGVWFDSRAWIITARRR
ncbi:MAG TPA: methyltransferase domain-containing protein [Streptosporangiaceae bacterium]|jgi:SAM-dependent methyltransferase